MTDFLGGNMMDGPGMLLLARQLRQAADRMEFDRAVMIDAAKVLESMAHKLIGPLVWPTLPAA